MKKKILCAIFLFSGFSPFAYACDKPVLKPVVVQPVVQRVQTVQAVQTVQTVQTVQAVVVVTEKSSVQLSLARLDSLLAPVKEYVDHCREELATANKRVEVAEKAVAHSEKFISEGVDQMTILRDVIDRPGCSVCVGGKIYTKDEIANVLTLKINDHQAREVQRVLLSAELVEAREKQKETAAQVEKWEAKQKELVNRVNSIREQVKSREQLTSDAKQAAAAKAAIVEANKLAESLETQVKSATPAVPTAVSSSDRVSQAAADFDRLFKSPEIAANR